MRRRVLTQVEHEAAQALGVAAYRRGASSTPMLDAAYRGLLPRIYALGGVEAARGVTDTAGAWLDGWHGGSLAQPNHTTEAE